jgi:D-aminoacyl-tRNA deacylase
MPQSPGMIALIQRVSEAQVRITGTVVGEIGAGLLAFIGVRRGDAAADAARLLERLLGYRVFADEAGRMNRSLRDTGGGLLLVPQFTLAADTAKGMRAGFASAAEPLVAARLFALLLGQAQAAYAPVSAGVFGEHMQVRLVNDGPVTFWLETRSAGSVKCVPP